jgi:hypothetical protein
LSRDWIHVFRVSHHPIHRRHPHTERLRDLPERMAFLVRDQGVGDVHRADFRPPAALGGETGLFMFRRGATAIGASLSGAFTDPPLPWCDQSLTLWIICYAFRWYETCTNCHQVP